MRREIPALPPIKHEARYGEDCLGLASPCPITIPIFYYSQPPFGNLVFSTLKSPHHVKILSTFSNLSSLKHPFYSSLKYLLDAYFFFPKFDFLP